MKKSLSLTTVLAILAILVLSACVVDNLDDDVHNHDIIVSNDQTAPAIPRGVRSITHDGYIVLTWYPNQESDLAGYKVYYSYQATGTYQYQAFTRDSVFYDDDVRNGTTYFYAVTAVDQDGNESDLSPEMVFDTPRPEGYNVILYNFELKRTMGGFNFASGSLVDADSPFTDIRYSCINQSSYYFVNVSNLQTQIQDFGYCQNLDQVDYSPDKGWSKIGEVEAIAGHAYIVWTADNHFAKFRINEVNSSFITLDWAYQIDAGNPELRKEQSVSVDSSQVKQDRQVSIDLSLGK